MVTHNNASDQRVYYGLSTDEKPTGADVANGSVFLEMNTAKIYLFDAANAQWIEWEA